MKAFVMFGQQVDEGSPVVVLSDTEPQQGIVSAVSMFRGEAVVSVKLIDGSTILVDPDNIIAAKEEKQVEMKPSKPANVRVSSKDLTTGRIPEPVRQLLTKVFGIDPEAFEQAAAFHICPASAVQFQDEEEDDGDTDPDGIYPVSAPWVMLPKATLADVQNAVTGLLEIGDVQMKLGGKPYEIGNQEILTELRKCFNIGWKELVQMMMMLTDPNSPHHSIGVLQTFPRYLYCWL
jgi:hypothetical protein